MTPSKAVPEYWDGSIPWVTPKDMKSIEIRGSIDSISEEAVRATGLQIIPPHAVLIVVRGMILARYVPVAVTKVPVTINQDMKALIPQDGIDARYLTYAMQAARDAFFPFIDEAGHGTKRLPTHAWKKIPVAFPPLEEQRAISAVLDYHGRRVNAFVRAKRRLIDLLNEQKQAVIHRAVTRGLDPDVRLKASGVEWIEEVPEDWQLAPIRRFAYKWCDGPFGSGLKSSHYVSEGIRVIRLQNIGHAEFRNSDAAFISPEHYSSLGDHDVEEGDLLIAGLGDERIPAGRACVAPAGIEPAMVKADCFRFRLDTDQVDPQFAAYQLSATALGASAALSTGATRQRVNLQATASRAMAIPRPDEQREIVAYLVQAMLPNDSAILRTMREIDLIREYRIRLIADVVTGKFDVRGLAADLPESADEEMQTVEEADDFVEGEELDEPVDAGEDDFAAD
jgi:type I restriction enzyme S subunit